MMMIESKSCCGWSQQKRFLVVVHARLSICYPIRISTWKKTELVKCCTRDDSSPETAKAENIPLARNKLALALVITSNGMASRLSPLT